MTRGTSGARQGFKAGQQFMADLVPGEVPYNCAQLRFCVETQPVVNGPYVPVPVDQAVAALSVGIISDQVESRHPP